MARNKAVEERVKTLVAEILAEEEAQGLAGDPKTIDDIEDEMVRIGDMVAREFGTRRLARHTSRPCEHWQCPDCGSPGEHLGGNRTSQPFLTERVSCTGSGHPHTLATEFDDGTFRGCCEAAPLGAAAAAV